MSVELWVERYRPKTLDEYVWQNDEHRKKVEEWLSAGALPHLLFSGSPGTGKTSLAELLLSMLDIPKGDIIKVNATRERHVEKIQERIVSFVNTWALGPSGIKYIILDEVDRMSPMAQDLLRGEIETYSDVCRFIMTCNQPQRLTAALHSRLQQFKFETLDRDEFTARIGEILHRESVEFDVDILLNLVDRTYPDLRKAINTAQQSVRDKVLNPPPENTEYASDFLIEAAALIGSGQLVAGRKKIVENALVEDYPDIYRFLYRNLELWGGTEQQKDDALLAIRKGLVYHAQVADPEINLSACLVELSHIAKG